jgi:hypothetical protein
VQPESPLLHDSTGSPEKVNDDTAVAVDGGRYLSMRKHGEVGPTGAKRVCGSRTRTQPHRRISEGLFLFGGRDFYPPQ